MSVPLCVHRHVCVCVCCQLAYVVWFTDIFCHLLYPTLSLSTCSSHCSCLLIAGWRERMGKREVRLQLSSDTLRRCIAHAVVINMSHPAYKLLHTLQRNQGRPQAAPIEVPAKCFNIKSTAMPKRFVLICRCAYRLAWQRQRDRERQREEAKWQELTVKCELNGES